MNSDQLHSEWVKFKRKNSSEEILENEICGIIESHNRRTAYPVTERVIRNIMIFSFLFAFCQNCYV